MLKSILQTLFLILLIACNEESTNNQPASDPNPEGSYTFNPNLPTAGLIDFSGFSQPEARYISQYGNVSNRRFILLELSGLGKEQFMYFYTDSVCITGYLGETPVTSQMFDYEIDLGENFPDGKFNIYSRLEDENGIFSECISLNLSYELDTSPPKAPVVQMLSPNFPRGNVRDLKFLFEGLEENANYALFADLDCSEELFSFEVSNGENSKEESYYIEGPNRDFDFYLKTIDKLGNISNCESISISYTLDVSPPSQPVISSLKSETPSPEDGAIQIKYPKPQIKIDALESLSTLRLYISHNNQDQTCSSAPFYDEVLEYSQDGSIVIPSLELSLDKGEGTYYLYSQMIDQYGNMSDCFFHSDLKYNYKFAMPEITPINEVIPEDSSEIKINYPNPKIKVSKFESSSTFELYVSATNNSTSCDGDLHFESVGDENIDLFKTLDEVDIELSNGEGIYNIFYRIKDSFNQLSSCLKIGEIVADDGGAFSFNYSMGEAKIVLYDLNNEIVARETSSNESGEFTLPHNVFDTKTFLKVKNVAPGNTLRLFVKKGGDFICENHVSEETLSLSTSKLSAIDLTQGEGLYQVYFQLTDIYGNKSECSNANSDEVEFQFLSPKLSRISPDLVDVNALSGLVEFSDLLLSGKIRYYKNYNDSLSSCDTPFLEKNIDAITDQLNLNLDLGDGEYRLFTQLEDTYGNTSECFSYDVVYRLDTVNPSTPVAGSHITISSDESNEYQFIFEYIGGVAGEQLHLYSDSSCSEKIGQFDHGNGQYLAGVTDAKNQFVNIYGKFIDAAGNESSCSDLLGTFELQLKVTGTLTYDFVPVSRNGILFDQTETRPIRNAYIELVDVDPESSFYNQVIQSGSTSDSGGFEFFLSSSRTVKLLLHAKMLEPETTIYDNPQNYLRYSSSSSVREVTGHEIINMHAESGWEGSQSTGSYTGERSAAPYAILDSIYSAYKKINDARPGLEFRYLNVFWNKDSTDGTYFCPSMCMNHSNQIVPYGLFLKGQVGSDSDEFDRHLVIHEWGHYFENFLSRSNSMGGSHGLYDIKDMSLAFGEGFATALSGMVFEPDAVYTDTYWWTSTYIKGFSIDIEGGSYYGDNNPGWFSEISVLQMVYDICDGAIDNAPVDDDSVALGIGPVIDVFTNYQVNTPAKTSIFSFVNGIKTLYPGYETEIDQITSNKGIVSIIDDWGTGNTDSSGNSVYINLAPNSVESITIAGNKLQNDLASNKHFKFQASSSQTKFTFSGNDKFFASIDHKSSSRFSPWSAATSHSVTISTTPGEFYSIRVYSSSSDASKSSISITVSTENL